MNRLSMIAVVGISILLAMFPGRIGADPPSLEGRWILVEQNYGKGKSNLVDADQPLCLEFSRKDNQLSARAWREKNPARIWDWPAWIADDRALPLEVTERVEDRSKGTILLRYRVQPSEAGDLVLEVEENYRVEEQGTALVGQVKVTFMTTEGERGSYTLHRRFERMP